MRVQWTIAVVAALSVLPVAGGQGLPLSYLTNGDFEDGLSGWSIRGTGDLSGVQVVSPGARGTDTAVFVQEVGRGSAWLHQDAGAMAPSPVTVLDFSAKVTANPGNPWSQAIMIVGENGQLTAAVTFREDEVQAVVFCGGILFPCEYESFDYPQDGAWHDYQIVLTHGAGLGVFVIDGEEAAVIQGNPAIVQSPSRVLFGDVAYHIRGSAPDVVWDEIYYGPLV